MIRRLLLILLLSLLSCPVFAQTSTAIQVLPGYLGTTGCHGSFANCYQFAAIPQNSAAAESSHVFKASAGTLFGLSVTSGASAGYVLIFNATTAPADGAVTPVACYAIAANTTLGIAFTPFPLALSTGITAVFSTTGCFTKTASATSFFLGEIL